MTISEMQSTLQEEYASLTAEVTKRNNEMNEKITAHNAWAEQVNMRLVQIQGGLQTCEALLESESQETPNL